MSKKDKIAKLFNETFFSPIEIAKELECSRQYVHRILNELGETAETLDKRRISALFERSKGIIERRLNQLDEIIESTRGTRAMRVELAYLERLAKMYGFDAPNKHEVKQQNQNIEVQFQVREPSKPDDKSD